MLNVIKEAAEGSPASDETESSFGPLQIFILTCHPERFDHLEGANQIRFRPAAPKA